MAGAILAAGLLVQRERAQTRPLVPIDLLRVPLFSLSVLTSVCSFAAYMLAFVSLPFFFETVLHRDQVQTGLLMTPWPVALGLVAPIAGRLSDRVPAAILGSAGLVCLAAGLGLMALLPASPSGWDIAWRMALCGLGFGFFQAPNNRTMLSAAPRNRAGAAGGMLATARLTGQTSGATIAALTFHLASAHAEPLDLVIGRGAGSCGGGGELVAPVPVTRQSGRIIDEMMRMARLQSRSPVLGSGNSVTAPSWRVCRKLLRLIHASL